MTKSQINILLVDDSEAVYTEVHQVLATIVDWHCSLDWVSTSKDALKQMARDRYDICLLGSTLQDEPNYQMIAQIQREYETTTLILLISIAEKASAVKIVDDNPQIDYLLKTHLNTTAFAQAIRYSIRYQQIKQSVEGQIAAQTIELRSKNERLQQELSQIKRVERTSRQGQQLYRQLFNLGFDGVEILDTQGSIIDCNIMYQRMVGRSHDEVIGRHTTTFVADRGQEAFIRELLPILERGGDIEGETELIHKDGSTRHVWRRFQTVYDDTGAFGGIAVYNRDITDRVQAMHELAHMASAVEQNPVAMMITDRMGKIEYVNFKFTELTHHTYESVIGLDLQVFKPEQQSIPEFEAAWQQVMAGEPWQNEYLSRTKQGGVYWELLAISPMIDLDGEITHCIVAKEDITLRKQAEAEVLSSQKRISGLATTTISSLTDANEALQQEIAERKRIEEALRHSQARLEAQYKGIPLPTYSWQRQGSDFVLVNYNDAAAKADQGNIATLVNQTVGAIFKDRPQVLADFARCFAEKSTIRREAPYQLLSTGEVRHFVTTYNFMPPDLIIVHIQDITKYKRVAETLDTHKQQVNKLKRAYKKTLTQKEAALQTTQTKIQSLRRALTASETRLKAVADNIDERLREQYRGIPVPTYSWQRIVDQFVLVDFNDAAAASMGRIVDFLGKTANEVFKERPQVLADFEQCFQEKQTIVREAPYQLVTTGEMRFFVTTYIYAPPNLVIVHIQDITSQKQMEVDLINTQKKLDEATIELLALQKKTQPTTPSDNARPVYLRSQNENLRTEVSEYEKAQAALREARARLKAQYKGIPVPTYCWQQVGTNLVLVDYNDAAEKATHGRIADFMGKSVNEVFKDRVQVLADFAACYEAQTTVRREAPYELVTTGETRYFVTTYNFVPPNLVIVYIQDITEQKQIELALKSSQEQIELACRFSPELALTFVNDSYCWYFDEERDSLIGQVLPFIFADDYERVWQHLMSLSKESPVGTIEYRIIKPTLDDVSSDEKYIASTLPESPNEALSSGIDLDEDIRWQQWINKAVFDEQGVLIEIRSVGRDITRRKTTKATLVSWRG